MRKNTNISLPILMFAFFISLCFGCKKDEAKTNWAMKNSGESVCGIPGVPGIDIDIGNEVLKWGDNPMIIAMVDAPISDFSCRDLEGIIENPTDFDSENIDNHAVSVAGIISTNEKSNYRSVLKDAPIYNIAIDPEDLKIPQLIMDLKQAEELGIRVVNMSFTTERFSQELYDYMSTSEMLFVCAAGNRGRNRISYPAAFELDNVISVVGINNRGECSEMSNRSPDADIAAPSENVMCLQADGTQSMQTGTSFAAPYVTACCAYLINQLDCDAATAKTIVCECANKLPSLEGDVMEGRCLSVKNVIEYIEKNHSTI